MIFNICKLQISNRLSNILAVPVEVNYYANNGGVDIKNYTRFIKYIKKRMKYNTYKKRVTRDALIKGTGFLHLYYSETLMGATGDFVGGLQCETIDMQNVAVSNPRCKEFQNNKWVIIRKKESVGSLKARCKDHPEIAKQIVEDMSVKDSTKVEIQDSDLTYVYLRYYRKNGEVYHSLSTDSVEIYKDKPMNRNLNKIVKSDEDNAWLTLPDDKLEEVTPEEYNLKFWRYPLEPLVLNESDDSLYGLSEIKEAFNTQRALNHGASMVILNSMMTAWDKYIVMPNALRNQVINDKGGQVLVDYSGTGQGIKRLGGMNAMANGVMDMSAKFIETFRTVNQITDLYSGENTKGDLAAAAIAQLNQQADKPIDLMRQDLWTFEEEIGKLIDLFVKIYYREQSFAAELSDAELIQQTGGSYTGNSNRYMESRFNPEDYRNVMFNIICEATQGVRNSELIQENLVQTLFIQGAWNNMDTHSRKFYLNMSPLAAPVRDKMLALADVQEKDEIGQKDQMIADLQNQVNQLVNALNRAKMGIELLGSENKSLKSSYKEEVKAHQDDIKVRDDAAMQLLDEEEQARQKSY